MGVVCDFWKDIGRKRLGKCRLNVDGGLWLQPMGKGSSHAGTAGVGCAHAARDKSSSPGYCILMQEMFSLSLFSA